MEVGQLNHIGIITEVLDNGNVRVKVYSNQCDGCKLGDLCGVSPENEMEIVVSDKSFAVGDNVLVSVVQNLEVRAIWFCLVIPCLLLFAVVIAVSVLVSALVACLSGIAVLVLYFGAYYLLKGKKEKTTIIYKVKKL